MPKQTERGDPLGFLTSNMSQNSKKMKGGPFEKKTFPGKKSRNAEKN